MKRIIAASLILASISCAFADNEPKGYYAIGYSFIQGKVPVFSANLGAIQGSLGWQANRYFAFEATGVAGVVDANISGIRLKLDSGYLVSVVPRLPINDDFSLYARIGYSNATFSATGYGLNISGSNHDTAFGGGLEYSKSVSTYKLGARLEYAQYYNRDGLTISGATLSFIQRF